MYSVHNSISEFRLTPLCIPAVASESDVKFLENYLTYVQIHTQPTFIWLLLWLRCFKNKIIVGNEHFYLPFINPTQRSINAYAPSLREAQLVRVN